MRVLCVEIPRRLIGKDDARVVRQRARDGDALLFPTGKMPARPRRLGAKPDAIEEIDRALPHFIFPETAEPPHRDHDVFFRCEFLEQEMELENESD